MNASSLDEEGMGYGGSAIKMDAQQESTNS